MTVFFDDSLEILCRTISESLGEASLANGVVVRDATGLLSFVCSSSDFTEAKFLNTSQLLIEKLGSYARPDRVIVRSEDFGAQRLLEDRDRVIARAGNFFCNLIDRRILGSGWLLAPVSTPSGPPRIVFASLKGGVGRSTALAVAAADLALRGKNVLIVDLDLEAPGLGDLMLPEERLPRFGVTDFLVENGIGGLTADLIDDFVGTSNLTNSEGGRVDVVPALGSVSASYPQNILPKISRAMIDDILDDGEVKTIGEQISEMLYSFSIRETYDVILIDSRAGLTELAAPAVLGLGATVLLFGTAQKQTISGYQALFSALKLLAIRDAEMKRSPDWRLMFKPVYAKASLIPTILARHRANVYELFADNLYDEVGENEDLEKVINFSADDPDAPHAPLVIPFDPRFVDFDPVLNRDHLGSPFYEQTFRPFLNGLDTIIEDATQNSRRAL